MFQESQNLVRIKSEYLRKIRNVTRMKDTNLEYHENKVGIF